MTEDPLWERRDALVAALTQAGIESAGPFLFRDLGQLTRVVALWANIAFCGDPLADGEIEQIVKSQSLLGNLFMAAQHRAEACPKHRPRNDGFRPVTLMTHWTLKLGRKTHAAVVPVDFVPNFSRDRFETLCARGSGVAMGLQLAGLDHINCPGCRNALSLGGFLDRD